MMTKRHFLKMSMGTGIAAFLAPLFSPASLLARVKSVPSTYFDSAWHRHWMKLTYNHGAESRQTRRTMGLTLRYMGMMRGHGEGYQFGIELDQALERIYQRYLVSGKKPASIGVLLQMLYDEAIYPRTGVMGGGILFGMLFAILRGRDGTEQGERVHQSYLAYRQATLNFKNAYKMNQGPAGVAEARKRRSLALQSWQAQWKALVEGYAQRQLRFSSTFRIRVEMLEGIGYSVASVTPRATRLSVARVNGQLIVSWRGPARLQQAPTGVGPWRDTDKTSPAVFDLRAPQQFFRAVQP